jgi:predicted negative regulator of RcsB-dependent stress response
MAEVKHARPKPKSDDVVERAKDFWASKGKTVSIICGVIILLGGGWLAYKYLIKAPKEQKAQEAVWRMQNNFDQDSMKLTLSGDRQAVGAEKLASQYSGTKAGNLAEYYAGVAALKLGDNNKAIKHLENFSTDAGQIQARAYKLLADAYANTGKNADALKNYKKAAHEFEEDQQAAAEYLFFAAYFADRVVKDKDQATELFKELKKKFPDSNYGDEADRYLAQAGIYKVED